jgi:hypothetical protein
MFLAQIESKSMIARLVFSALAGLIAIAAFNAPARASETFVIGALDGYGIGDCLANRTSCGRIVADAWCEAHGLANALAFGPAEDVTASIGPASTGAAPAANVSVAAATSRPAPGSFIVTCAP